MNINNICRVCLEKGPKLMPIFDPIKPPHFSILIMACASVQVNKNKYIIIEKLYAISQVLDGDGLPRYICQKCITKLNIAFQFKTQCESSDAKLRQCFEQNAFHNHLPATPDFGGFMEVKKDETNQVENNFVENTADTTGTVLEVQNPPLEMQPTIQEIQIEAGSSLQNDLSELKLELVDLKPNSTSPEEIKGSKKSLKQHQCDTCGKVFRTKPGLVHHIRIHTGERPYVCHLCDKRFINGGHLHTHMRTHTGEKNHICAACNKAFATAQQLTKHTIAIHTSERPYGCTYCSKRFASSSNLNTHIKIHTGEKNYHCDQCGKAFSTKGQLYQHMLVHTGEKAFLCEYCNKRFSQKAHLIRHLKTHKS